MCLAPIAIEAAGPEAAAKEFLEHVQRGAVDKAKALLESPNYRFQHPGGDDVYFRYESGYDPNLAFLVGRPFVTGTAATRQQRSDWYIVDGTVYADLAIPLRFESQRPWVLPGPIAFGRPMDFIRFMNFVAAPAADPSLLSLRIRPSIEPGQIKAPTPQMVALPPPGPTGARIVVPQLVGADTYGALSGSRPVDPAPVVLPSGEALTIAQLSRFLPRLASIRLNISLIRRGRFASWSVVRWHFTNGVLITERGEVIMSAVPGMTGEQR